MNSLPPAFFSSVPSSASPAEVAGGCAFLPAFFSFSGSSGPSECSESSPAAAGDSLPPERDGDCPCPKPLWRERQKDWLVALLLSLLVICFFGKTVFGGASISRVCRQAERDSVFSCFRSGVSADYDCSIYQSLVPYYFLTAEIARKGTVPLWNPYAGCGAPLAADILTTAFAPLRLLLSPWASLRIYNLILVLQVVFCAAGTFFLARVLSLSRSASAFAAISFAFCPYILFANELQGTSISFFPALFVLFVRMSQSPGRSRAVACGIGCAVVIASGHPELSFFGIAFASFLFVLLTVSACQGSLRDRVFACARALSIAGVTAFCFAAPVLLPFAEYLASADCYKSALSSFASIVPLSRIAYNLAQPGFGGASSYLGIVAAVLLPLSLFAAGYQRRVLGCLIVTDVVILAAVSRLGPLDFLLREKFLQWLVLDDAFPLFLLLTAVIAAWGFEVLVHGRYRAPACLCIPLASACLIFSLPWAYRLLKLPLESAYVAASLQPMTLDFRAWTRDLIIFGIMALSVALLRQGAWVGSLARRISASSLLAIILLVLGFVSEASVAKNSMPAQPRFEYRAIAPLPFLKDGGERIVTMGRHALCPNANFLYGIANLVTPNVQYPGRFLGFVRAAGITVEGVNQFFDGKLSPLVDLASVKYVVSPQPVLSTADRLPAAASVRAKSKPAAVAASGVGLITRGLSFDRQNWQVVGQLEWSVDPGCFKRFSYAPVVQDAQGHTLWFGDRLPLGELVGRDKSGQGICQGELAALVPPGFDGGRQIKVGVQLFDSGSPFAVPGSVVPVGEFEVQATPPATGHGAGEPPPASGGCLPGRRFRFLSETPVNHVRVYENTRALPRAYVVHQVLAAGSAAEALRSIQSPAFEPRAAVVLEGLEASQISQGLKEAPPTAMVSSPVGLEDKVLLERPSPNEVRVKVNSATPCYLVLTDVYYPGWQASLDGKPGRIYRANYLFRAVSVPSGAHSVCFSYEPLSFTLGLLLFAGCLIATVIFPVSLRLANYFFPRAQRS